MENFMNNLEKKAQDFTPLEKEVIKFVKNNPDIVNNITITQFSDLIFVSSTTISRTLKKLGFNGFSEFKYKLNELLNSQITDNTSNTEGDTNQFIELIDNLKTSLLTIDRNSVQQFIDQVKSKQNIAVFGVGASSAIASDLSRRLFMLGYNSTSRTDWDELEWQAKNLSSNDLAIIVSLSGETKQLVSYAKEMKSNNVYVILLVAMPNTTLEQYADLSIVGKSKIIYYQGVDVSFRSPLTIIVDYLIYQLTKP